MGSWAFPISRRMLLQLARGIIRAPAALAPSQASSSQEDLLTRHGLVVPRATASFDAHEVGSPSVMLDGDTYKMWYHASDGGTWRIAYATSSDGQAWTLHGPVLSPSLAGEGFVLAYGDVVRLGSELWMWYTGSDWNSGYARVFLATSPDGMTWTKRGVALDVGPSGSMDDRFVYDPSVQIRDRTFYMWYTGLSWAEFHPRIFLATSPDGLEWTKHGMVMSEGEVGSVDDGWSYAASVRFIAGRYYMIYTGAPRDFSADRLFFAESADGRAWTNRRLALDVLGPDESPRMGFPALLLEPNGQWAVYYAARGVQQQIFLATRAPLGQGLLRVTTAIDLHPDSGVPGKILVDGIPRDEWGLTWLKMSPGSHTISFSDVPRLGTPPAAEVTVVPGQVTEFQGVYAAYGWLRVRTNPPVPGTIFVSGVPRNDWGVWMAMPPGTYEVAFGAVEGHRPPSSQTVTVLAETLTEVVGSYRVTPGARGPDPATFGLLRVSTGLDDGRRGVPSRILVDRIPRDEWGLTWVKLEPGNHTVSFSDVPGLGTPEPALVEVRPGQATEVRGLFQVQGSLRIATDPPLPATIFVDGIARNDWGMWQSMPPGRYEVSFGPVEGYLPPTPQVVAVLTGELTTVTGSFAKPVIGWSDPSGDVSLANADLVGGSGTVADGLVDFRVQFSDEPFPTTATHQVSWCIDTDHDIATGDACGYGALEGADAGFTLFGAAGALSSCDFTYSGTFDPTPYLWYDETNRTLRALFPLDLLADDSAFHYALISDFGGSLGASDEAPDGASFSTGRLFRSERGGLPFYGSALCRPSVLGSADPTMAPPNLPDQISVAARREYHASPR